VSGNSQRSSGTGPAQDPVHARTTSGIRPARTPGRRSSRQRRRMSSWPRHDTPTQRAARGPAEFPCSNRMASVPHRPESPLPMVQATIGRPPSDRCPAGLAARLGDCAAPALEVGGGVTGLAVAGATVGADVEHPDTTITSPSVAARRPSPPTPLDLRSLVRQSRTWRRQSCLERGRFGGVRVSRSRAAWGEPWPRRKALPGSTAKMCG